MSIIIGARGNTPRQYSGVTYYVHIREELHDLLQLGQEGGEGKALEQSEDKGGDGHCNSLGEDNVVAM